LSRDKLRAAVLVLFLFSFLPPALCVLMEPTATANALTIQSIHIFHFAHAQVPSKGAPKGRRNSRYHIMMTRMTCYCRWIESQPERLPHLPVRVLRLGPYPSPPARAVSESSGSGRIRVLRLGPYSSPPARAVFESSGSGRIRVLRFGPRCPRRAAPAPPSAVPPRGT
jgi:hypothetical protein